MHSLEFRGRRSILAAARSRRPVAPRRFTPHRASPRSDETCPAARFALAERVLALGHIRQPRRSLGWHGGSDVEPESNGPFTGFSDAYFRRRHEIFSHALTEQWEAGNAWFGHEFREGERVSRDLSSSDMLPRGRAFMLLGFSDQPGAKAQLIELQSRESPGWLSDVAARAIECADRNAWAKALVQNLLAGKQRRGGLGGVSASPRVRRWKVLELVLRCRARMQGTRAARTRRTCTIPFSRRRF